MARDKALRAHIVRGTPVRQQDGRGLVTTVVGEPGAPGTPGAPGLGMTGPPGPGFFHRPDPFPILMPGPPGTQGPQGSAAQGGMTLIGAASGTDSSTAAANVATFAISGLTALDTLLVICNYEVDASHTLATPQLYSVTDSIRMCYLLNGTLSGGGVQACQSFLAVRQGSTTNTTNQTFNAQGGNSGQQCALTTVWTGSWTLALRHLGVTAGGTMKYRIAVYKIAGQ